MSSSRKSLGFFPRLAPTWGSRIANWVAPRHMARLHRLESELSVVKVYLGGPHPEIAAAIDYLEEALTNPSKSPGSVLIALKARNPGFNRGDLCLLEDLGSRTCSQWTPSERQRFSLVIDKVVKQMRD